MKMIIAFFPLKYPWALCLVPSLEGDDGSSIVLLDAGKDGIGGKVVMIFDFRRWKIMSFQRCCDDCCCCCLVSLRFSPHISGRERGCDSKWDKSGYTTMMMILFVEMF
jgi:hypothetical protein